MVLWSWPLRKLACLFLGRQVGDPLGLYVGVVRLRFLVEIVFVPCMFKIGLEGCRCKVGRCILVGDRIMKL